MSAAAGTTDRAQRGALAAALVAEHGSPLWLIDVDRFRTRLRAFTDTWRAAWPETEIGYSYKTNRTPALLHAAAEEGARAEVVCAVEYELAACVVGVEPARIIVNGPAKPAALWQQAGGGPGAGSGPGDGAGSEAGGPLVNVDSEAELARAADAGVERIGLRVAMPSFTGAPSRFGTPAEEIVGLARRAAALELRVEALSAHLVSSDFDFAARAGATGPGAGAGRDAPGRPSGAPGAEITLAWPRPPAEHAAAARTLAGLAAELAAAGLPIATIDLGGGFPPAPAVAGHAEAVAGALRDLGFAGRLLLEPGRALVADAVELAFTVVAVKQLADGRRCLICDAGTNLLPGALLAPVRLEAAAASPESPLTPALVTGPLCLNTDVLHPAAELPRLAAGDLLLARAVGAYQQVVSTQFGEPRPAAVACDRGRWALCRRAEELHDLMAQEALPALSAGSA